MFDYYANPVNAGANNGVNGGVFIPQTDLPGLTVAELGETGTSREGKVVYGLVNSFFDSLGTIPSLGVVNLTKSDPQGSGVNRFREFIAVSWQWLLDFSDRSISPIPLPTIGASAGEGGVSLSDVWVGAEIIALDGGIPTPGIVIRDSVVSTKFGGIKPSLNTDDARGWLGAFWQALVSSISVRSTAISSAITSTTNFQTTRGTGIAIPATWYDPVNPVTGVLAENLPNLRVFQESYSVEYEMVVNPANQTLEIYIP
jgi:hypothetical protein